MPPSPSGHRQQSPSGPLRTGPPQKQPPQEQKGISVSVDERRLNIGERVISIRVTNATPSPVSITAAEVTTPLFHGTITWVAGPSGSSTLRSGTTVALPASLTTADCGQTADPSAATEPPAAEDPHPTEDPHASASPAIPLPTAVLTLDGSAHAFPAEDPHTVLKAMQAQDCLAEAAREVAVIALPREVDVAPDRRTAVVRLAVSPTGASGDLVLNGIGGTTLLAEDPGRPWPGNVEVSGSDLPSVVEVSVRPARCDPHALAEDKTGTRIPVHVTAGPWSGQLRLEPTAEFTRAVYDFVAAACVQPGPSETQVDQETQETQLPQEETQTTPL